MFSGRHAILETLGGGGMGIVYTALRVRSAPVPTSVLVIPYSSLGSRPVVVIHSVESGTTVRELRPALSYLTYPRWSPDGRQFVARGADTNGRSGIVKFDAVTGAAALVVPNETCSNLPQWAASGRSVYCYKQSEKSILEVDVESSEVLRSFPGTSLPAAVSPDGRLLVQAGASMKVLTLAKGESREIFRSTPDSHLGSIAAIAWTPDSRSVAFAAIIRGEAGIWLVSLDGGQPRKILDVAVENKDERGILLAVSRLGFNPTTGHMAYSLSPTSARDVWKMENFLPKPIAARK